MDRAASVDESESITIQREINSVVVSIITHHRQNSIKDLLNDENNMVHIAGRKDQKILDWAGKSGNTKNEKNEEVNSLALPLELRQSVDHGTHENQLPVISSAKMLYKSHFGYLDADLNFWDCIDRERRCVLTKH